MYAHHPRWTVAALACFSLLACALSQADSAAPPPRPGGATAYEGTWRVVLPRQRLDFSFWLVKIEEGGKKVNIVSGFNQYAKSKVTDVKADARSISFTMTTQLPQGQ